MRRSLDQYLAHDGRRNTPAGFVRHEERQVLDAECHGLSCGDRGGAPQRGAVDIRRFAESDQEDPLGPLGGIDGSKIVALSLEVTTLEDP